MAHAAVLPIATTNLLPNVVMAFVIIQALKITGLLDWVGHICQPVMALWELPGEAATIASGFAVRVWAAPLAWQPIWLPPAR